MVWCLSEQRTCSTSSQVPCSSSSWDRRQNKALSLKIRQFLPYPAERGLYGVRDTTVELGNGNCTPGGNQSCRAQLGWQGLQPQRSPGLELLQSTESVVWLLPHMSSRVYQYLPLEICMTSSKSGFLPLRVLERKVSKRLVQCWVLKTHFRVLSYNTPDTLSLLTMTPMPAATSTESTHLPGGRGTTPIPGSVKTVYCGRKAVSVCMLLFPDWAMNHLFTVSCCSTRPRTPHSTHSPTQYDKHLPGLL